MSSSASTPAKKKISSYCASLPIELADCLDLEFSKVQSHYLLGEWDDLQIDSGRMCEAILRLVEWKMSGSYTPIDGRSRPNRLSVVNAARRDTSLPPSFRLQLINLTETIMDFRNNRNSAHLGAINPNQIDATTVYQMISWILAEIIRLESSLPPEDIQTIIQTFAERPTPVIYKIDGLPIALSSNISFSDEALILLYDSKGPLSITDLFSFSRHSNITVWRKSVIDKLARNRLIYVKKDVIHILPPGMNRAEELLTTLQDLRSTPMP